MSALELAARIEAVRERIARAAERGGRSAQSVTLVAVSKTFPADVVREAFDAGLRHFGENKVQEAEAKYAALDDLREAGLVWHGIGHVQSNKASKAVRIFDRIHSLDSVGLARRYERLASEAGARVRALVQVNLAGEASKSGMPEAEVLPALREMGGLEHVSVEGLMILPPWSEDAEQARGWFGRLRALRDEARDAGLLAGEDLSMGMSHDLEVAVEEGATLVRVGTAIFGPRVRRGGEA
jgi:pyridoxal phosphate enzyme (YggS family)